MNGGAKAAATDSVAGNGLRRNPRPSKPVLDTDASAPVRDRLVNEIAALDAVETAIEWAGQNLGAKNALTAEDASTVEAAFRDRMRLLEPDVYPPNPASSVALPVEAAPEAEPAGSANPSAASCAPLLPAHPPKLTKAQGFTGTRRRSQQRNRGKATPLSGQGSSSLHCDSAVHCVWPAPLRGSPPSVRPAARTRPQGIR